MNTQTKQIPRRSGWRIVGANDSPTHETSVVGPKSNQDRPRHPGRLCAAEIDVLLRPYASFSPGRAMTWALEELLCRGHFLPEVTRGGIPTYRVSVSPVPRSERPALASFAPLFDGHPRAITAQALANYVAQEFGDKLEVRDGYPCGSPLHWYERCVVDPLRAEGLVRVFIDPTWLGPSLFFKPTPHGEGVAAPYRDILSRNRHRRGWRRPWRAPEPVALGPVDATGATLQRNARTRTRARLFVNDDFRSLGGVTDAGGM